MLKSILLSLLFLCSGCGFIDYYLMPTPQDTAQELAEAGQGAMQSKDYEQAIEFYNKLKDRYPFSPYTAGAELGLGDAYFLNENYSAAVEAYKEFESLHPRDEHIPYVLFQIGLANFKQLATIDLPQEHMAEALEYFNRIKQVYPGSAYAQKAGEYIYKCRMHQAEHEIFVADFYWRQQEYRAAWSRYIYISKTFPDLPKIVLYAKDKAQLAYLRDLETQGIRQKEKEEGSWRQWLDWL